MRAWSRLILGSFVACCMPSTGIASDCPPSPNTAAGDYATPKQQGNKLGRGLRIKGIVVGAPDCKPISEALVETWQAGNDGIYLDRLRTSLKADQQGRFVLETEWPNFKPPHIHFHVAAPGFQRLVTMTQFEKRTREVEVRLVLRPYIGKQ